MKKINAEILAEKLEIRMAEDIATHKVGGASLIVNQSGKNVYKKCFSTDFTEVKENTIFRLASMTKPITAVAALICQDRGLFSVSDPVKKYLPECDGLNVVKAENGKNKIVEKQDRDITIIHLLSHTSGICCGEESTEINNKMTEEDRKSVDSIVPKLLAGGISFQPGTNQSYSGYGAFDVLVKVIENVTGEDFQDFIKENIFKPCEMTDTTFDISPEQRARLIPMHNRVDEKSVKGNTVPGCTFSNFPESHRLGGAGLVSTLTDYSNFAEMLLNKGTFNGKRVVSEKGIEQMQTNQVADGIMPGSWRWGLGVRIELAHSLLPKGLYGWSGAYGSHFWVDPENEITAVYMKNSQFDGGAWSVTSVNFEKDVYASLL